MALTVKLMCRVFGHLWSFSGFRWRDRDMVARYTCDRCRLAKEEYRATLPDMGKEQP